MVTAVLQGLWATVAILASQVVLPASKPPAVICGHCECTPVCAPCSQECEVNLRLLDALQGQLDRCGPANLTAPARSREAASACDSGHLSGLVCATAFGVVVGLCLGRFCPARRPALAAVLGGISGLRDGAVARPSSPPSLSEVAATHPSVSVATLGSAGEVATPSTRRAALFA